MGFTYLGYRVAQCLSARLPQSAAFACAERLSDVHWKRSAKDRLAVRDNLSILLEAPTAEHAPCVREVFRNFGRYLVEFFAIGRTRDLEVRLEGEGHLRSAWNRQRGVIILTAHLGNWEVGAILLSRMGFPTAAVALPHADPQMDRLFNRQRERCGVRVIPLDAHAARRSLQSLRAGGLLGLLGDRDFSHTGIAAGLCGQTVKFPRGPATLSLRSRAPIVPTFLIREGIWKFRLWFEQPIWPGGPGAQPTRVRSITRAYAAVVEQYLRRYADQWLMFQPLGGEPSPRPAWP